MSKTYQWVIGVIVLIVVVVGGYLIFHKSNKNNSANNNSTYSSSTSTNSSSSSNSSPNKPQGVNNSIVITKDNASLGEYLAKPDGSALYIYGGDTSGVSNCTGSCLANWPAYAVTSTSASLPANITVITRSDNHTQQYAYKGKPLYTFVSDQNGQVTGNGVADFSIAKP